MIGIFMRILIACLLLCAPSTALLVSTTNNANTLANALFNGPGITVLAGSSYTGGAFASGTFSSGPFGIGTGTILTSGAAFSSLPGGSDQVHNGQSGSAYCGSSSSTRDGSILSVNINLDVGYDAVLVEFILASAEPTGGSSDPIGIYLDSQLYALDGNGGRITAQSDYLTGAAAIFQPDNDMSYSTASPPLLLPIFTSPGPHTMVFAMCDYQDEDNDSALLINAYGCAGNDCPSQIQIDYVTTTVTVAPGATTYTSTTSASHTTSGTIEIGVLPSTTSTSTTSTTSTTTTTTTSTTDSSTTTTSTTDSSTTTSTTDTTTSTTSTTDTTTSTTETTTSTTSTSESTTTTSSSVTTSTTTSSTVSSTTPSSSSTTSLKTTSSTETSSESVSTTGDVEPTFLSTTTSTFPTMPSLSNSTLIRSTTSRTTTSDESAGTTAESAGISTEPITSTELTGTTEASSGTAASPSSSAVPSTSASNLSKIGKYKFAGCAGSAEGYPSFVELSSDPDMTTERCIALGSGKKYVGIFNRSCYVSDSLDEVKIISTGRCNLECPGDPGLFCGGILESAGDIDLLKRQDFVSEISPRILLTLYSIDAVDDGTTEATTATETPTGTTETIGTSIETTDIGTSASLPGSAVGEPSRRLTIIDGMTRTVTETAARTAVTVTYTAVNPESPGNLIVTNVTITIEYYPCGCVNQGIPAVEMTTTEAHCQACGLNGEDYVTLTVPKTGSCAAESTSDGLEYPGSWHQYVGTDNGDESDSDMPAETTQPYQSENISPEGAGHGGQPNFVNSEGQTVAAPTAQHSGMRVPENPGTNQGAGNSDSNQDAEGSNSNQGTEGSGYKHGASPYETGGPGGLGQGMTPSSPFAGPLGAPTSPVVVVGGGSRYLMEDLTVGMAGLFVIILLIR